MPGCNLFKKLNEVYLIMCSKRDKIMKEKWEMFLKEYTEYKCML